jgi:molybdate transport system substrate-binding protein
LIACATAILAGCGSGKPGLTVSAAASLRSALTAYASTFSAASVRESFGGSDLLAAQIREGIRPDVFASANLQLPAQLYAAGLLERPTVFATNVLVVAAPATSGMVRSLADLERPGVTLAIGSPSVPIGSYTRQLLRQLGRAGQRILANVRSEEPDVSGIVAKIAEGAVDAGFVYLTDVRAAPGALRAIALPASLRQPVAYAVAIVRGTPHRRQAQQFIAGLLSGAGAADLRAAGFGPP